MTPQQLSIKDFSYELPTERVALYPLEKRDESKLLHYCEGLITNHTFADLPQLLPNDSLLVFNNSSVMEARLHFTKSGGSVIEIFALEPHEQYETITNALQQKGEILYKCLVGGAAKWKSGNGLEKKATIGQNEVLIYATMLERRSDCFIIKFHWTPSHFTFESILQGFGEMPIPPYLHRSADATDKIRYQTIYASHKGSVAAPTAGLHFTNEVMSALAMKQVSPAFVTLHVGAGTFKPVQASQMVGHEMHAEFIDINVSSLEKIAAANFVTAVGTTSMRTLESIYWMGVKTYHHPNIDINALEIKQWEVYEQPLVQQQDLSPQLAIKALIVWMLNHQKMTVNDDKQNTKLVIRTSILIAPGYHFKLCDALVTNFHQPNSTLLLLVAAFIGSDWRDMYQYALKNNYRFLSYGDSSLLFRKR